jgi:hypothetical protein
MPNASFNVLAKGARQFVVQLAFETQLTGAGLDVVRITTLGRLGQAEDSRRFQNDFYTHVFPGQLGGILDGQNLDRFAIDD